MHTHKDDVKWFLNHHSPRFNFSKTITEIKFKKNQQSLPFLFSSNRNHTNWVKALNSPAGLTNRMKCIWDQNMKWVTEQGRKRSITPPPVSSHITAEQHTCSQRTHKHLLRSEAFKSAADDDNRLFMAGSACLRFAVEVDRLLAV